MADEPNQVPANQPSSGDKTPPAEPKIPDPEAAPKVDGAASKPPDDLESIRKSAEEYEKAKPLLDTYGKFEKVLESDKELATAIEDAVKSIAEKRKAPQGVQTPPANPQAAQTQTTDQGSPTTIELRNEIRMRDYLGEFFRVAQSSGITEDMTQEAFDGTVQEILKMNNDPLSNFDMSIVKKGFDKWNERVEKIVKFKNDAYSKSKAKDEIPAQGSGQAPREGEKELYTEESRRNFIEQGLRASMH